MKRGAECSYAEGFTVAATYPAIYGNTSWASNCFAAAGFWVDDCIAIGSGRELATLSKSVDAKYGLTGPGEVA